jgi:hypothetical protein
LVIDIFRDQLDVNPFAQALHQQTHPLSIPEVELGGVNIDQEQGLFF